MFLFCSKLKHNSLNSQSVYTWGVEVGRRGGDLCSLCHVLRKAILTLSLVTEWMMKKKKMGSQMK